ncbi:MAG: helix-turn-helix domain-containing protein [Oceanicaulis sp.]
MRIEHISETGDTVKAVTEWATEAVGAPAQVAPLVQPPRVRTEGWSVTGSAIEPPVTLRRVEMNAALVAYHGQSRIAAVFVPREGRGPVCARTPCGHGEAANFQYPGQILAAPEDARFTMLTFPAQWLRAGLARADGGGVDTLAADDLFCWSDKTELTAVIAELAEIDSCAGFRDLTHAALAEQIIAAIGRDFAAHLHGGAMVRHCAKRALFSRAHRVFDALSCRPVPVHELSQTIHAPEGRINDAFIDHAGVAPRSWHLALRLTRARAALERAQESHCKVSDVARRYGFTHMGRFSTAYSETFREYPSATLKAPPPYVSW